MIHRAALAVLVWLGLACAPAPPPGPPDLLLLIHDTLRFDAVSANGRIEGTTPYLDELAAAGIRYTQARSTAPWTLPAHASLFSGQLPPRHGVGAAGRMVAPASLPSVVAVLREAGYQTAGFSENPVVSPAFGLARGFDHFESRSIASVAGDTPYDVDRRLREWLEGRDPDRPFFVFVNLMDAHEPHRLRRHNPYLAPEVTHEEATQSLARHPTGICRDLPPARHLEILHALYHGDVQEGDRKLERIHGLARDASRRGLVSVITSDHGEHFGERRLMDHQFSLSDVLLRIPLVVHGTGDPPGVVDAPVSLVDVTASLLELAGVPAALETDGAPLPRRPPEKGADPRAAFGFYSQWRGLAPESWPEGVPALWSPDLPGSGRLRAACGPEDRVFGEMGAVATARWKLIEYEHHPSELYDLDWDEAERSDVARHHPDVVARLEAELTERRAASPTGGAPTLDEAGLEALRALGYVD